MGINDRPGALAIARAGECLLCEERALLTGLERHLQLRRGVGGAVLAHFAELRAEVIFRAEELGR